MTIVTLKIWLANH